MLPLRDDNPSRTVPWVTYALIALNVAVFAYQLGLPEPALQAALTTYGVVPRELVADYTRLTHHAAFSPGDWAGLVTSMFMHGGWMHIGGNMLFLYIFGDNVEDTFGHTKFLAFYLACGLLASLAHVASEPASAVPTIGASGAISGVLGAYLALHPTARVTTLVIFGFFVRTLQVPAFVFLGLWFVMQSLSGLASLGATHSAAGGVAWFAHIGGFVAGAAVGLLVLLAGRGDRRSRPPRGARWRSDR